MTAQPIPDEPYFSPDAPWEDRQWFDLRPERAYRLRAMQPSEFPTFGGSTHVVVQKIDTHERMRVPVTLLGIPPGLKELLEGDGAQEHRLDAVLAEIFAAALSGRSVELGRLIQAGVEKARNCLKISPK